MFFCRRGNENMHSMTKDMFQVETDENTGRKVVKKLVDELTKNHRFDKEKSSGIIPEIQGSIYCPVLSFEMYTSKLHPDCDRLWQQPKDSFMDSDVVSYCNAPVGEKKLSKFLSSLSKAANLSKVYTNHSIRATEASILSKCMFGPSQVMSVTGHKSVQSLSVYHRVSNEEKIQMGESLGLNLVPTSSPSSTANTAPTNNTVSVDTESALYEVQNMEHDVVEQLFSDFNEQENQKSILRPI